VAALFQDPTPRGLARRLERPPGSGARPAPGLLLRLTPPDRRARCTLICVPYGGGNAVAYYPLARALPGDIALESVALPGHDFGAEEPLRPLEEVARACAEEIRRGVDGPIAVYGHCIGVALAVELTRRLEAAGRDVRHLFLAGSYPFPRKKILGLDLARVIPFERWETDQRVMRYLRSLGGFEEVVEPGDLAFVMRNFRHDGAGARRYFTERYAERDPEPLRAPITFVAGADDPETPHFERRYTQWRRFGDSVGLAVVPGGGHYFLKHDATTLAGIIGRTLRSGEGPGNDDVRADAAER
jgi:surfactin synthase thioesterase subunit